RHKYRGSGTKKYRPINGHGAMIEIAPKSRVKANGFDLPVTEPDQLGLSSQPLLSELGQCGDLLRPNFVGRLRLFSAIEPPITAIHCLSCIARRRQYREPVAPLALQSRQRFLKRVGDSSV